MPNFAVFDNDMNASLESTFFPKIEASQTVENENRQHEYLSQDSDSEDEIIFQFDQSSVNTYELAHEFYEAQLHSDNDILTQDEPTEENDNDARIFSQTDPDAILLDKKMRSGCTCNNKNCYRSFDPDVIIEHRLTMREYEKHEKESYLIGKLDQC